MEFLMDPSIWVGLLTLIVLVIVLGIDNVVFIAILAQIAAQKARPHANGGSFAGAYHTSWPPVVNILDRHADAAVVHYGGILLLRP